MSNLKQFLFKIKNFPKRVEESDGTIFTTVSTAGGTTSQLKLNLLGKSKTLMEIFYLVDEAGFLQTQLFLQDGTVKRNVLTKEIQCLRVSVKDWQYLIEVDMETIKSCMYWKTLDVDLQLEIRWLDQGVSRTIPDSLSDSFHRMIDSAERSDVDIVSSDSRTFKAHKVVLTSRSAVFASMLNSDMREAKSNVIVLDDIDAHLLKELLSFIYTDRCPGMADKSQELLHFADKYQLEGLKVLCAEDLFRKVTPENAIKTLILSDMYNAQDLRKRVVKYIKEGPTKDMLKSKEWKEITSCELFRNLIEELLLI